jgi:hypothetical protein
MTTGPRINLAYPNQTAAEAADLELAKWAALQIHKVRMAQVSRHGITAQLNEMSPEQQERAKYWLNHYRTGKQTQESSTA